MLQSDLNIDVSRLRSDAIPEVTKQFNQGLISTTSKGPQWFEVGPAKYREMRLAGKTAFPPPTYLDGTAVDIPSRESGRSIPCRIIKPDGDAPIKGIFMHVHGGGWVLSMCNTFPYCGQEFAQATLQPLLHHVLWESSSMTKLTTF